MNNLAFTIVIIIIVSLGLMAWYDEIFSNKNKDKTLKHLKEIQIGKLYYLNDYGDPFKERITVVPVEIKNGFVKIQRISSGSFKFSNDVFDSMPCDVFLMVHKLDLNETESVK